MSEEEKEDGIVEGYGEPRPPVEEMLEIIIKAAILP